VKINRRGAVVGAAAALAAGIGVAIAFAVGGGPATLAGGPANSAGGEPSWCMDSPKDYNSPGHGGCVDIAGCQNELQILSLEDKLAIGNPIGSSGYGSDTDVAGVLKKIQLLNTQELHTPNIPPPIKTARQQDAAAYSQELNAYNSQGDWVSLQAKEAGSPASNACLKFQADSIRSAAATSS
jgi:hypothetical protein